MTTTNNTKQAYDYCVARLRRNPRETFRAIRDDAAKRGYTLYPVSFGRAQYALGIAKRRAKPSVTNGTSANGEGFSDFTFSFSRPDDIDIANVQHRVEQVFRDGQRLRAALESIRDLLDVAHV